MALRLPRRLQHAVVLAHLPHAAFPFSFLLPPNPPTFPPPNQQLHFKNHHQIIRTKIQPVPKLLQHHQPNSLPSLPTINRTAHRPLHPVVGRERSGCGAALFHRSQRWQRVALPLSSSQGLGGGGVRIHFQTVLRRSLRQRRGARRTSQGSPAFGGLFGVTDGELATARFEPTKNSPRAKTDESKHFDLVGRPSPPVHFAPPRYRFATPYDTRK
jgi:hypothetical protein